MGTAFASESDQIGLVSQGIKPETAIGAGANPVTCDLFVARRTGRCAVWGLYALCLLMAPLIFTSSLSQTVLSQMGIAIIVCLSFNILLGQGGMLSFGHAVYAGLGSFIAIHALNLVSQRGLYFPVSLIPVVGGMGSALFALTLGWVTTKKTATPFAMITLGVGELVWAMALMFPDLFGGEGGISGNRVTGLSPLGITLGPQFQLYYLIAAYAFVCTALMFAFTCTPMGRMLNAARDNPERVEFVGYDTRRVRYIAFVVAAFFAGIGGALAALNFEIVTSEVVSSPRSGAYMLFTFLGGTTVFFGPILGAVLMVLAVVLLSEVTKAWLLYLGLTFIFMVMYAPGGVASLLVLNLRMLEAGRLKKLWVCYLALMATASLALLGTIAAIEMVYRLAPGTVAAPTFHFLGVPLDVRDRASWLLASLAVVSSWSFFELARRRFVQQWDRTRESLAGAPNRQESA